MTSMNMKDKKKKKKKKSRDEISYPLRVYCRSA